MNVKGIQLNDFPSPFGVDGDVIDAFLVIKEAHARGSVGSRVITVTFDVYASEAAFDAGKPAMSKYSYTITEIYEGTSVNGMDEFFDTLYQVVKENDATFANATLITKTEEE